MSLFQTLKERPTHDAHEGFCFERLSPLDLEFDLPSMESLVTGLAQRDEIVRRIAPGPSALNVVNIEYRIFGLPTAVLTNVSVPKKHVFPHVPKSELLTLLVRRSGNVRGLQQLRVKHRCFDGYGSHRQDPHDRFYTRHVRRNAVFHRRS